jgi:hypothetical protein
MAATAAILDLVSVDFLTNAWVDWSEFWWLIGSDWRKVPFDDQLRHSSKMAAAAAILELVSIDFLTNACDLGVTGGRFHSMFKAPPLIQDGRYGRHLGFWFPLIFWSDILVPHWG